MKDNRMEEQRRVQRVEISHDYPRVSRALYMGGKGKRRRAALGDIGVPPA
jgi:hypothetical protein